MSRGDEIDSLMVTHQSATMMHRFYRGVLYLVLPLVWLRLLRRARSEPEYGLRRAERFGGVPESVRSGCIWVHTVSAGETIAAAPLIAELAAEFADQRFLVTTMTPTGSAQVQARLAGAVDHCYAPYDFGFAIRRFFDRVQPRMLVLMETELWPNMIAEADRRDVPVYLVNARLSAGSAAGYARIGGLTRPMLQRLSYIACQSEEHVERFVALGAAPDTASAMGSVKYDVALPEGFSADAASLRSEFGFADKPVWIAASTHPGEDEQVLEAFKLIRSALPQARLVLVPRHPVRADEVCDMARQNGYRVRKHSEGGGDESADVLVGDVMGTLLALYGIADVAFVGGSLVENGGHNPLEPAVCRLPVLCGPHQFNFTQIMAELSQRGGLITVDDAQMLGEAVLALLQDEAQRRQVGEHAAGALVENAGATRRVARLLGGAIRALPQ